MPHKTPRNKSVVMLGDTGAVGHHFALPITKNWLRENAGVERLDWSDHVALG